MRRFVVLAASAIILLATTLFPLPARADGAWLDDPTLAWNQPGMVIPPAPAPAEATDPRCGAAARPDESPEEQALQDAGWTVWGSYVGGWGVRIVQGLATYDGMCRPWAYQTFVFVGGKLAGTLSPDPMYSRFDGALTRLDFYQADQIVAEYVRYTEQDPLCCPSARSTVTFTIEQVEGVPVVVRQHTTTQPTRQ